LLKNMGFLFGSHTKKGGIQSQLLLRV
jgi:hypothetical protein